MTDLRLALRMLVKQRGMSLLAIVALCLGIGLTTTMFSIVNGAVIRGLPFEDSDRIYHLARLNVAANADDGDESATLHDFGDWRARQQSFEDLAAFYQTTANIVGPDGTPERYTGAWVSANMLRLLGASPALGRDFRDEEGVSGAAPVVIVSDRVWRERFHGNPDAIGQTVRVNGTVRTLVGVMPPRFAFPVSENVWMPIAGDVDPARRASSQRVRVIGRLKAGVPLDRAEAEFNTIAGQLQQQYPDTNRGFTVTIKTYIQEFIGEETIALLMTMLVAVFGVLIIAAANVANLVLARAAGRTREIAVRTAMGASRLRVVRQMLTEVLLLAVIGAAAGLAIAQFATTLFNRAIVDTRPPFWIDVRIDATVLAFVTLTAVVAAIAAGIVPAVRASRTDLASVLSDEGRTTGLRLGRFSKGLVIAEMAVSFSLLLVSALVIQSIGNASRVDYGFAMDVWAGRIALPDADYPDAERRRQFQTAVIERVRALPGVVNAAITTEVPPQAGRFSIMFPGQTYATERDYPMARGMTVSRDYFTVLRAPVVQGRAFDDRDGANGPLAAIVNESFARRFFPEGALGKQFALGPSDKPLWRTIVGVVPDLGIGDLQREVREGFYLAAAQRPQALFTLLVHAAGPPLDQTTAIRQTLRELDRNLPVFSVTTIAASVRQSTWPMRVFGSLFTAFGVAALFLATIGLYGVMAFSVRRRTAEIGIRMAVGAGAGDVLRLVLRQGLVQIAIGLAIGSGLAAVLGPALSVMLFGVSPHDPLAFIAIAIVLGGTGLVACLIPALRAARIDPMAALRHQ